MAPHLHAPSPPPAKTNQESKNIPAVHFSKPATLFHALSSQVWKEVHEHITRALFLEFASSIQFPGAFWRRNDFLMWSPRGVEVKTCGKFYSPSFSNRSYSNRTALLFLSLPLSHCLYLTVPGHSSGNQAKTSPSKTRWKSKPTEGSPASLGTKERNKFRKYTSVAPAQKQV